MYLITRNYREKIKKLLSNYPIVFILGPRQCGKTTFVRNQLPDYEYLDLEKPSDEAKIRTEPELFFENHARPLILDEAQRAPEIFPILRSLADQNKKKGQYVLLGSANLDLVQGVSESLAGRVGYLDMSAFMLDEVYGNVPDSFHAHWLKGGFPDAFLTPELRLNFDWFENYTRSLIERDLPVLGIQLDPIQFRRLWTMLVLSHGDILNMNKLASAMGISPHTVDRYIGILERSFLLRRLPPYFSNLKKRLVKSPKIYVRDSGILHYFLRVLSFEELSDSPHRGESFEGYALEQVIQAVKSSSPHFDVSYFRTADGIEVDLLLSDGRNLFPIEFKAKLSPGKEDIEALLKAQRLLGFRNAAVMCLGDARYPLADGIECIGIEAWARDRFPPFWRKMDAATDRAKISAKNRAAPIEKVHPWRMCPAGQHWVKTHSMHFRPTRRHPIGGVTTRHAHCAHNPSGKDQLYPDEIHEIAESHFSGLKDMPCPLALGFPNGSKFDDLIAGWVQYWNEVLKPSQPLDPNLAKALIASESGFNPAALADKKNSNSARGLMQITDDARAILGDESGELPDHYVTATKKELNDPGVNICAGIRWLFRKKDLASVRLNRASTWIEAAEEYKGDLKGLMKGSEKSRRDAAPFLKYLNEAKKCGR